MNGSQGIPSGRIINGVNMDDPGQNPLYGRWDPYSIVSFIIALCLPVPFIPAILGAIAIHRTTTFRMKGLGLAIAAIVLNLIYSFFMVWMTINGLSVDDLYEQMMQLMTPISGNGRGDQINA